VNLLPSLAVVCDPVPVFLHPGQRENVCDAVGVIPNRTVPRQLADQIRGCDASVTVDVHGTGPFTYVRQQVAIVEYINR
jgi:hypothetical protein